MIRKLLAAALAACLILTAFAGCSDRGDDTPVSSEGESTSAPAEGESGESVESGEGSESSGASTSAVNPNTVTTEQAAAHNADITEKDFNLVQFDEDTGDDPIAVLKTSEGDIRIRLFQKQAPKTVENFVGLAEKGYYNGTTFHKVIEDFMVQAGDSSGTGTGGESFFSEKEGDPGYFDDEFSLDLWNFRGAVTMANAGRANSNSSQFFIVQRDVVDDNIMEQMTKINFPEGVVEKYAEVGGVPSLDWKQTVFGMVIDGMDVVDKIAGVKTDADNKPEEPVLIDSITIEKK